MSELPEFRGMGKTPRWNREIIVTEKIDGTNAVVHVADDGTVTAGKRTGWITPEDDNFGFAAWVADRAVLLAAYLGPGYHYGEWWGLGINRGYGLDARRFSLFHGHRYTDDRLWFVPSALEDVPELAGSLPPTPGYQPGRPRFLDEVPVLYRGPLDQAEITAAVERLRQFGSVAAGGYPNPEGVVVYHTAASRSFKITLERDDYPKSTDR